MKIYMFGGSFDPPHLAHVEMISHLISDCDKFYIFPAKESPNKVNEMVATSDQRFEMCQLSFESISPKIIVSNFELELPPPSYTINTVKWLLNLFPNCQLSMIIGEDHLEKLDTWYKFEELQNSVNFICFSRKGANYSSRVKLEYIHNFNYGISSTDIRNGWGRNLSKVKSMLHPDVFNYILENKLYSC